MTIKTMLASDALDPLDLNCAEKILYAANEAYGLGLDPARCGWRRGLAAAWAAA